MKILEKKSTHTKVSFYNNQENNEGALVPGNTGPGLVRVRAEAFFGKGWTPIVGGDVLIQLRAEEDPLIIEKVMNYLFQKIDVEVRRSKKEAHISTQGFYLLDDSFWERARWVGPEMVESY